MPLLWLPASWRAQYWLDSQGCRRAGGAPTIRAVIEREQVLHVAKLARLRLSDAEVEKMAGELSGILGHVDRISELDLDVEPTSHVVDLENVLRPDVPRPSWPREAVLEQAPDPADGAFRVPSPQAEA
jgi:aspartyl-tRNA(Asn)/glutamyl-tRNA(Gln) amidotransferase subunit C